MIYLDNNATTQVDKRVLKKMLPFFTERFNNPHSQVTKYNADIIKKIDSAREYLANLIGAKKEEIIFTSGATESNNLAIKGLMNKVKRGKNHFLTLNTEHKCVLEAMRRMEIKGAKVTILNVDKKGLIDIEQFLKSITDSTVLVSIMFANNETGVIQPIEKIGKICKDKNILFHTDAAQAVGKIEIDVKKMNIDMMSISGHKFYGPKGIGALYMREKPRIRLETLIDGGGQEMNIRSGTLPVPLCIGIGEAAKIAKKEIKKDSANCLYLRNYLIEKIKKKFNKIHINGCMKNRLSSNLNFSLGGINSIDLINNLDYTVISAGSACTSAEIESSYVLSGMGLKKSMVESSIRIGISKFNTRKDIDKAIDDIYKTVMRLKNKSAKNNS